MLILTFSLLSQGFLFSVSKSLQNVEDDDMLLNTFTLGKSLRNGDKTEKTGGTPLEHYKMEDASFQDEEEDRNPKFFVSFRFLINSKM